MRESRWCGLPGPALQLPRHEEGRYFGSIVVPVPPHSQPNRGEPRSPGLVAGVPAARNGMRVTTVPSTAPPIPVTYPRTTPFESVSIFWTYLDTGTRSQPQLFAAGGVVAL